MRPAAVYEVQSAPAGRFHFLVHLFSAGELDGSPHAEAGGELRWVPPREIDPHPNLAIVLVDLGLIERDAEALRRDLASASFAMDRLL